MLKRAVFEISRRELSLDVSVAVHIFLVLEQSSLESQPSGCAKTPILTVVELDCSTCGTHVATWRPGQLSIGRGRRRIPSRGFFLKKAEESVRLPTGNGNLGTLISSMYGT